MVLNPTVGAPTLGSPPVLAGGVSVPTSELIGLCAGDSELYCHTFFPQTFRQASPAFHREVDDLLENPRHRYVALEVFRGGAKTTKLRAYLSKRIAYGISRTILVVSESQERSKETVDWLRTQVEHNKEWTGLFGLEKGGRWTGEVCEIKHTGFRHTVTVVAVGITGQIRGINIKDYRPDLIIVDDPCNEENTATPEQRKKMEDLFFGALAHTLTPKSECPDAKMVLLQTSLDGEDLINRCHKDPMWNTRKYSILTLENESIWPERFSTEDVLAEKAAHINRNQLPLWMREMECSIIASELSDFRMEWLQYWEMLPQGLATYIGIDPVPPPREGAKDIEKVLAKRDFEVISVVGVKAPNFYLLDVSASKGHTPEWTKTEFFRLVDKWRPLKARVEGTAYQATLKWLLEQEMTVRRRWVQIDAPADKRKKRHRILQSLNGICSSRRFFVNASQTGFISQYGSYPNSGHDDILDSVSMAVDAAMGLAVGVDGFEPYQFQAEPLPQWRQAP